MKISQTVWHVRYDEQCFKNNKRTRGILTFQMKQDVGPVVLEHLRHKLHVHVLDVYFLHISGSVIIIIFITTVNNIV